MRRLAAVENVTLDGVMQGPGRPDEDTRGGFAHGGWAPPYRDAVMGRAMGGGMSQGGALVFGRRTYEDFHRVWPGRTDNPFTEVLNRARKFVASTTLREPLPWMNSTLLQGDAAAAVAGLKTREDQDMVILGSGTLVRSLLLHRLIDDLILLIHPVTLGTGQRLFPEQGALSPFTLLSAVTTTTGVIIATYRLNQ